MNSQAVGARIRRLREEQGLSQRDVTRGLPRCSYAYLSRIEAGTRTPSRIALQGIADRLGVTALYLETGRMAGRCPHCGRDS